MKQHCRLRPEVLESVDGRMENEDEREKAGSNEMGRKIAQSVSQSGSPGQIQAYIGERGGLARRRV